MKTADARAISRGRSDPLPLLRLVEGEDSGLRGFIVACLPSAGLEEQRSLQAQVDALRRKWEAVSGYDIQAELAPPRRQAALAFHWNKAVNLCAGIGAEVVDFHPASGRWLPLFELVGLRKGDLRRSQPLTAPRLHLSPALSAAAIAAASAYKMHPLSAFDERAWASLRSGWELSEYRDRRLTRAQREAEIRRTVLRFGRGTAEQQRAEAALLQSWSADPRRRPRSRVGWWSL